MKIATLLRSFLGLPTDEPRKTMWLVHVDGKPYGTLHPNYKAFHDAIATASKEGRFPQEAQITVKRVPSNYRLPLSLSWGNRSADAAVHFERVLDNWREARPKGRKTRYWRPPPRRRRSRVHHVRPIRVRG